MGKYKELEYIPKVSVEFVTDEYRGDHSKDIRKSIECGRDTTIGELVNECLEQEPRGFQKDDGIKVKANFNDHLEIRLSKKLGCVTND